MASIANKFAFFATLALGRDLQAGSDPLDNPRMAFADFIGFLAQMDQDLTQMQADWASVQSTVTALNGSMSLLDAELITNDYFYMNDLPISIPKTGRHNVLEFTVPAGETLDLHVNVSSDQAGKNNALFIFLYQDDQVVAQSVDDGDGKDDNGAVAMLFKKTMGNQPSNFRVTLQGGSHERKIPATQLQIGYKTFGSGYELTMLKKSKWRRTQEAEESPVVVIKLSTAKFRSKISLQ